MKPERTGLSPESRLSSYNIDSPRGRPKGGVSSPNPLKRPSDIQADGAVPQDREGEIASEVRTDRYEKHPAYKPKTKHSLIYHTRDENCG